MGLQSRLERPAPPEVVGKLPEGNRGDGRVRALVPDGVGAFVDFGFIVPVPHFPQITMALDRLLVGDHQEAGPPCEGLPASVTVVAVLGPHHPLLDEPLYCGSCYIGDVGRSETALVGQPFRIAAAPCHEDWFLKGEEELEAGQRADGAPLHSTLGVPVSVDLRVEGFRRPDVVLPWAVADAPDAPLPSTLLDPAQLGSATFKLSALPAVVPVLVVGRGLFDPFDILGGPEAEDEAVVRADETLAVGHQGHGRGGTPFLVEGGVELRRCWNPRREDEVYLLRHILFPDYLPNFFHSGEVPAWCSSGQFPRVGHSLPNDD